jgi:uncharacterized protein YcfJ
MKPSIGIFAVVVVLLGGTAVSDARGCIKGAVAGAVVGHFAGHHGAVGAVAGCIIGRHEANKQEKRQQDSNSAHR